MSESEILIDVRAISKHYTLGNQIIRALDEVSLQIAPQEFVLVLGPSGSGKSTLVNMIGGVDKPDKGEILIAGRDIAQLTAYQLTLFRRESVGYVFQFYSLIPTLTAYENISIAAELLKISKQEIHNRTMEVLEAVGLADRANSYPSNLSGGERQRIALARALVKRPDIIVVDEPTGQLDEATGRAMVEMIRDTSKNFGSTVIMVTHDQTLREFADRVITLHSGRIQEASL